MSYIEKNKAPGEAVLAIARLHWTLFVPLVLHTTILVVVVFLINELTTGYPWGEAAVRVAAIGSLLFILCRLTVLLIRRWTTELSRTSTRIVLKEGFILRRVNEISLGRLESISIEQSILGRILNYGYIVIRGAGGISYSFGPLPSPMQFSSRLQKPNSRDAVQ